MYLKSNFILLFTSVLFAFVLAELAYSFLYVQHYIEDNTLWFHEASEKGSNLVMDPDIGYKIAPAASRFGAVTSSGVLESYGIMQGNNMGFPDKRNFYPKSTNPEIKRIAVLGDSFTASQFTAYSWLSILEKK